MIDQNDDLENEGFSSYGIGQNRRLGKICFHTFLSLTLFSYSKTFKPREGLELSRQIRDKPIDIRKVALKP